MIVKLKWIIQKILSLVNLRLEKTSRVNAFRSSWYIRHNQRRQEHLSSLNLDLTQKSVLEVGAGIGDHTRFWLDRNCDILITEAREENLKDLYALFPNQRIQKLDLDDDRYLNVKLDNKFDIVYCYGLLYHLENPGLALTYMSNHCKSMLLLETCVSYGNEEKINNVEENKETITQSISGFGCRPTRHWVFNHLKRHFKYVYIPITQPAHPEFPLNWNEEQPLPLKRAVFIASRIELHNNLLIDYLPDKQYLSIYQKQKSVNNS